VRLHATLVDAAPGARAGEPFYVELPEDASVLSLMANLGIDPSDVHLTMIDGRIERDRVRRLSADARVALFPPVGGG